MATLTAAQRAARAQALGPTDLVLSHLTVPRAGFEERVAAAAGAGFAGIGLNLAGYRRLRREGWTIEQLADVLDRYGQLLVEIEFLQGWAGGPADAELAAEEARLALELVAGLGARHLQLGSPYQAAALPDADHATEAFAALCDQVAPYGVRCAIEYLPEMTPIGSAAAALAVVEAAGRPNGGICVDSWHHERGPDTLATLAAVDGRHIASVQLDDGLARPAGCDYMTDTSTNRLPPGEGAFDLVGLLRTLGGLGVRAPIGLEIISPAVAGSGDAATVARRAADGMRAVLAAAGLA